MVANIHKKQGFTIVELLIVIVVIGILAAIVIVAYAGVQNRANDSAVQTDIKAFANNVHQQYVISGNYPTTLTAAMGIKFNKSAHAINRNNLYYCVNTTTNQFAIFSQSKSGNAYIIKSGGGVEVSASLGSQQTCALVGLPSNYAQAAGYDYSGGTGWAGWTN